MKTLFVILLSLFSFIAFAAGPQTISYQGVINDSSGSSQNITVNMRVRLFDSASAGVELYNESHNNIVVTDGLFALALGGGTGPTGSFDASLFADNSTWLELEVAGETLSPRQAFLTVPYAMVAETVSQTLLDRITALEEKLEHMTVVGNEIFIDGANLNIRSGQGSTDAAINGLGNLIVGYNESNNDLRTGSHNLVVGKNHSYNNYGGLVAGENNAVRAAFASVSGGKGNVVVADYGSVSGGSNNNVDGNYGSVSGGNSNFASASFASVSGGLENEATGDFSSVGGGEGNTASDEYASVSGDSSNVSQAQVNSLQTTLTVVQGTVTNNSNSIGVLQSDVASYNGLITNNTNTLAVLNNKTQFISVTGTEMVIDGANLNIVNGLGFTGSTNGLGNLILGYNLEINDTRSGSHNLVLGDSHSYSSYGGLVAGRNNTISGSNASVTGGNHNIASGAESVISGGEYNETSASYSSISGGRDNLASGLRSSILGGNNNIASAGESSVGGGSNNTASNVASVVVGGFKNKTDIENSVIQGGRYVRP